MVKVFVTAVALLVAGQAVSAFDPKACTGYSFSARDYTARDGGTSGHHNAWFCGLPPHDDLYCAETRGFAWSVDAAWCNEMVSAVRNGKHALTDLPLNRIATPNGGPLEMWTCYITNRVTNTTQSYVVDYTNGALPLASNINNQCTRNSTVFSRQTIAKCNTDWNMPLPFNGTFSTSFVPTGNRNDWATCFYNNLRYPGQEYKECKRGNVCEFKNQWWSTCLPDPKADHQCCLAPNGNTCETGQCCLGYRCNTDGNGHKSCVEGNEANNFYKGICTTTGGNSSLVDVRKPEPGLGSRCYTWSPPEAPTQGDCARGYNCIGSEFYSECYVDRSVVNECNFGEWETDCRPGDCAPGLFCKQYWKDGKVSWSHCRAGVEPFKRNGVPVHDGLCSTPDIVRTYNEKLGTCNGNVCTMWGDPHVVSCDGKKWDCQAAGLFVIMRNFMYEIQGHFTQMKTPFGTSASITDAVVIDFKPVSTIPKIQFMYPKFVTPGETYDPKRMWLGSCPVLFYVDDVLINVSNVTASGHVLLDRPGLRVVHGGSNKVLLTFSLPNSTNTSVIEVRSGGDGPFNKWGCIFDVLVCLPSQHEKEFIANSGGLLGTPDGNIKNEWIARNGTIIPYGDSKKAFDFCVSNWCVTQTENIMGVKPFSELKCPTQTFVECGVAELLKLNWTETNLKQKCCPSTEPNCEPSAQCKLDLCATGETAPPPVVELINPTPKPNLTLTDDCSDLGKFVSGQTGAQVLSASDYPVSVQCTIDNSPISFGDDESFSVFVGKSYQCIKGTGVEGNMFVNYNFVVDNQGPLGCSSFVYTPRGSCTGPPNNKKCIQVGGDVKIGSSDSQKVEIMPTNGQWSCDFVYKGTCTAGPTYSTCGTTPETLRSTNSILADGQVARNSALDLASFQSELTVLAQKQAFWKDYAPTIGTVKDLGIISSISETGTLTLSVSPGNSAIQVFNFPNGFPTGVNALKFSGLEGKTVLINVGGTNNVITVPYMMDSNDSPGVSQNMFSMDLTTSMVWNFYGGSVTLTGSNSFQGSVVVKGDLNFKIPSQLGRTIVLGNLIQDMPGSTLMNYPFKPQTPLPLPASICTIEPPPACVEAQYKFGTANTLCPSAPAGFKAVSLLKSQGTLPAGVDVLYNIQMLPPPAEGGAPTVKFSVDNPFPGTNADIYVKYEKAVGKFALDPACKRTDHVADCEAGAVQVEAGCISHDGYDPYSIVTIYFASEDSSIYQQGLLADVDKCCYPEDYKNKLHTGVVSFTYEIKCACPIVSSVGAGLPGAALGSS